MWTLRSRAIGSELIDGPIDSPEELEESFRDIALVNKRFGGIAVARHALRKARPASVLDVACGAADIPVALMREHRIADPNVAFTCLDLNEELLALAREKYARERNISFVHGDGANLPFEDASFDVAMCNLALHHFEPAQAVAMLRELRRVSRRTPIVTDLRRSVLTWLSAFAFSRVFSRNRLTRHDAPMSARRAYTPSEAMDLASSAGWIVPVVEPFVLIRMVLYDAATL